MAFQESAESWRSKLHLSQVRFPVLIGVTVVFVLVLCGAGKLLFDSLSSQGFALQKSQAHQSSEAEDSQEQTSPALIRIHVGGAVVSSGVYEIAEGARVLDAIQAAGGFVEGAARDALNLARVVTDGEQIVVPSEADLAAAQAAVSAPSTSSGAATTATPANKININTASADQLDALPGVGASTAAKIIADREANGPFKTIEDLKRVSGIGDKKYAALADSIVV